MGLRVYLVTGTYGNLTGATMMNVQKLAKRLSKRFDYAASLRMVDNYLPDDIKRVHNEPSR
ncbi:hypothetical protein [Lacrimispora defluvii]|uniref:Flavodoxin-like protein n=1 Tax=Lacrimispora defluvii TaxID=2719233 RepID=A0ABX1VWM1_9FIRM|nr:hypothetical protein [Lacrimispora defluvii]NNJ32848.1 hypothetical protein [Lacrimispora defluvii]